MPRLSPSSGGPGPAVAAVRELLAAAKAARRTKLDAGLVDTVFMAGDRVLLRIKEVLDAADVGKLCPRWTRPILVSCARVGTYPSRRSR